MQPLNKDQELISSIKNNIIIAKHYRKTVALDTQLTISKIQLQNYQINKLKKTHEALLNHPNTQKAANFFIDEIYNTNTIKKRDNDIEKLVPMLNKVFPRAALEIISNAMELDALTEKLDFNMITKLGVNFSEDEYNAAYKNSGDRTEREKQLFLTEKLGTNLIYFVSLPLIETTLKVMKMPAKLLNLSEMHQFLYNGFYIFKHIDNPQKFINDIIVKEKEILNNHFQDS